MRRNVKGPLGLALAAVVAVVLTGVPGSVVPAQGSAPAPVSVGAGCDPPTTTPNVPASCYAYVAGVPGSPQPTGSVHFWGTKGTTSPTACQASSVGCTFTYTPTGAGSATRRDTITVVYVPVSPDEDQVVVKFTVAVRPEPSPVVAMSCQSPTTPGVPVGCTAQVAGNGKMPLAGELRFSVPAYKGTVTPTTCAVAALAKSCHVSYVPTGRGSAARTDAITVKYAGDPRYADATAKATVEVDPKPYPLIGFGCSSYSTTPGTPLRCALSVQGISPLGQPTGHVSLSAPSYRGTITPASCPANTQNICNLTYTAVGTGSNFRVDKITVSYPGDARYAALKTAISVDVTKP